MNITACIRFPRFKKYRIDVSALSETDIGTDAQRIPLLSDDDFLNVITAFGLTSDVSDGGWALPDGSILNLRRSDIGGSAVRHSYVYDAFPEKTKETLRQKTGLDDKSLRSDDMSPAIDVMLASGAIRYHFGPDYFYCSVERKPTPMQIGFLRDVEDAVSRIPSYRYSDIVECSGKHMTYSSPEELSRRLANDVSACF